MRNIDEMHMPPNCGSLDFVVGFILMSELEQST